jgi:hypothetical protein
MCTRVTRQEAGALVAGMVGKTAWGAILGVGNLFSMEFGEGVEPIAVGGKRYPRGEWHLLTRSCEWRIEADEEVLAGSEDDRERLRHVLRRLTGLVVNSVSLATPANDATWVFAQGISLRLFSVCSTARVGWHISVPDGRVLVVGPGSVLSWGK